MPEPVSFHGVLPALITPFTADGEAIDATALTAIVDRLVAGGVGGLVPGGSTGEFTTMSHAERRELVEVAVAAADGRVPVVAGTGALSTRETVALSRHAEQAGAAAVMVVPPFYDPPSWRELQAHYAAVADAIDIPIMYYNLPGATGVTLTSEQLRALPVSCLKDTGGDASWATELIQADGGPTLLNGYDTQTFAALAAGVQAVVWGVASIVPERARAAGAAQPASSCTVCSSTTSTCPPPAPSGPACGRSARSSRPRATRPPSRPPACWPATRPARCGRRCSRWTPRARRA